MNKFFLLKTGFWESLEEADRLLFLHINRDWTLPALDAIMPFLREANIWMPLYLFVLLLVFINFRGKGLWWAVFFVCTVALTDMTGTYVFKHNFQRLRPCADPEFSALVRHLINRCAGYSFTSNHAANHFGMAAFFFISFRHVIGNWAWVGFAWAFLIGYAQIYIGLHYPLDVICGALIGIILGLSMGSVFNKRFGFANFDEQQQPVA